MIAPSSPGQHALPQAVPPSRAAGWWIWLGLAALLLAAPLWFDSGLALTMLSQMGIAIIALLSYNLLFGQGGMLSFGHAVYSGLGAYAAIHALNAVGGGTLPLPVSLVPLVGGLAGLLCAALLGGVSTRRSGTAFAMITLGVAELVFAVSLMFSGFFGGEGGVSADRVTGTVFGISWGPAIQVYYLIAAYTFASVAALHAFTLTPLGRLLNAVRDNPQRVSFIGYDPRRVRFLAFLVAGFFAGVSGGLAALNFEIVTPESLSTTRSGAYLLFVVLGGAATFYGPIIGAVLMVLAFVLLSGYTRAWLLYLGLLFIAVVMLAPGGLAGIAQSIRRATARGGLPLLCASLPAMAATAMVGLAGVGALVEMVYHRQLNAALGAELPYLGLALNTSSPDCWFGALFAVGLGGLLFVVTRRQFLKDWQALQEQTPTSVERSSSP